MMWWEVGCGKSNEITEGFEAFGKIYADFRGSGATLPSAM